jgi:hypothetical protein
MTTIIPDPHVKSETVIQLPSGHTVIIAIDGKNEEILLESPGCSLIKLIKIAPDCCVGNDECAPL